MLTVSTLAQVPAETGTPETITVIGERQDKRLLDTTSSVAIYDKSALQKEVGQTLNEVAQSTANTLIRSLSEAPIVRGIEGGGPGGLAQTGLGGTQPRVPVIIDDIVRPSTFQTQTLLRFGMSNVLRC